MDASYVICMTGASGASLFLSYFEFFPLLENVHLHVVFSNAALKVWEHEKKSEFSLQQHVQNILMKRNYLGQLSFYRQHQISAKIASGSFSFESMVILPCSMGSVARIQLGLSQNLIERAADVCLKEKKKLIIVPRESVLSSIHLKNLYQLSKHAQVSIIPAMIPYYTHFEEQSQMNFFIIDRVLTHQGLKRATEFYEHSHEPPL